MQRSLLVAVAVSALATPAIARDYSGYVGIEGGALFPRDNIVRFSDVDGEVDVLRIDNKRGFDLDLIAGYDLGMVRAEAELGWKRAKHDSYADVDEDEEFEGDGRTTVLSLMGNALFDVGGDDTLSFYGGGGIGWARTKFRLADDSVKDSNFAWQLIAGARFPLAPQVDVGAKYRYFQTKFNKSDVFDDDVDPTSVRTKFKSHSVLGSVVFNFAPPVPPPPPAPAAIYAPPPPPPSPATQTCADGSFIPATEPCPVPAPIPRGERG